MLNLYKQINLLDIKTLCEEQIYSINILYRFFKRKYNTKKGINSYLFKYNLL